MLQRIAVALALVVFSASMGAQQRDRAGVPERYKWDLTHIYPSNAAWRAHKDKLETELPDPPV